MAADYSDEAELLESLIEYKAALHSHFNTHYAGQSTSQVLLLDAPAKLRSTLDETFTSTFDFTARIRRRPQAALNELDEYFRMPRQEFSSCNPVQWWYTHRFQFPNLYRLARDILSIPGLFTDIWSIFHYVNFSHRVCCCCGAYFLRRSWYYLDAACKPEAWHNQGSHVS